MCSVPSRCKTEVDGRACWLVGGCGVWGEWAQEASHQEEDRPTTTTTTRRIYEKEEEEKLLLTACCGDGRKCLLL